MNGARIKVKKSSGRARARVNSTLIDNGIGRRALPAGASLSDAADAAISPPDADDDTFDLRAPLNPSPNFVVL